MAYADIATLQTIATGQPFAAATLQQIRDNCEFLIDPPGCSIHHNTTQSVADNTATALLANSEFFDNDSMHSTSSNTSRVTIQTPGRYMLFATVTFTANATGHRAIVFRVNGSTSYNALIVPTRGAGAGTFVTSARTLSGLVAGDYVECLGYHTAGASLTVQLNEFAVLFQTR